MYFKKYCCFLVFICMIGCGTVKVKYEPIYSKPYDFGYVESSVLVPKNLDGDEQLMIITEDADVIRCDPTFYVYSKPRISVREVFLGNKQFWEVSKDNVEWYEVYNTPNISGKQNVQR